MPEYISYLEVPEHLKTSRFKQILHITL